MTQKPAFQKRFPEDQQERPASPKETAHQSTIYPNPKIIPCPANTSDRPIRKPKAFIPGSTKPSGAHGIHSRRFSGINQDHSFCRLKLPGPVNRSPATTSPIIIGNPKSASSGTLLSSWERVATIIVMRRNPVEVRNK